MGMRMKQEIEDKIQRLQEERVMMEMSAGSGTMKHSDGLASFPSLAQSLQFRYEKSLVDSFL